MGNGGEKKMVKTTMFRGWGAGQCKSLQGLAYLVDMGIFMHDSRIYPYRNISRMLN